MESVFVLIESLVGGIRVLEASSLEKALFLTRNMHRGRDVQDFKLRIYCNRRR